MALSPIEQWLSSREDEHAAELKLDDIAISTREMDARAALADADMLAEDAAASDYDVQTADDPYLAATMFAAKKERYRKQIEADEQSALYQDLQDIRQQSAERIAAFAQEQKTVASLAGDGISRYWDDGKLVPKTSEKRYRFLPGMELTGQPSERAAAGPKGVMIRQELDPETEEAVRAEELASYFGIEPEVIVNQRAFEQASAAEARMKAEARRVKMTRGEYGIIKQQIELGKSVASNPLLFEAARERLDPTVKAIADTFAFANKAQSSVEIQDYLGKKEMEFLAKELDPNNLNMPDDPVEQQKYISDAKQRAVAFTKMMSESLEELNTAAQSDKYTNVLTRFQQAPAEEFAEQERLRETEAAEGKAARDAELQRSAQLRLKLEADMKTGLLQRLATSKTFGSLVDWLQSSDTTETLSEVSKMADQKRREREALRDELRHRYPTLLK